MGAQTWEDVKGEVKAVAIGGIVTAVALVAGICAIWPAEVLSCVGL